MTYVCIRFINSYHFLSSSLDSLVEKLVDNSHEKLKAFEKEIVDNDEILKNVTEIKTLITEVKWKNDSIKDIKKEYQDEIEKLEEAFHNYNGEKDLETLKTDIPDNRWKNIIKNSAYPYEYHNSIDDYQKAVDNLSNGNSSSELKNKCPDDEEIELTKEIIKEFNIKNGDELTKLYLKSDVLLLACVFEKFIKVAVNKFRINPLYCVSLPGSTWQCGLKYRGINLQTLQDKDLILLLEKNIRGGISSIMADRYVKSDENRKIM